MGSINETYHVLCSNTNQNENRRTGVTRYKGRPTSSTLSPCERRNTIERYPKRFNNGDNSPSVHKSHSRLSLAVRYKLMPCLSHILKRSNDYTKRKDVVKETQHPMQCKHDNSCQAQCTKPNKIKESKKDTILEHMYSENELDNTDILQTYVDESNQSSSLRPTSCNYTASSFSLPLSKNVFKKMIENKFQKTYRITEYDTLNKELQCPESHINNKDVIATNSSLFWGYLLAKISKKYQKALSPCQCNHTHERHNAMTVLKSTQEPPTHDNYYNLSCQTSSIEIRYKSDVQKSFFTEPDKPLDNLLDIQPIVQNLNTSTSKLVCKCSWDALKKRRSCSHYSSKACSPGSYKQDSQQGTGSASEPAELPDKNTLSENQTSCQDSHDLVKQALQQKYNGEVLCIHNPPCILINGCLHLPPSKVQYSTWPAAVEKVSVFCQYSLEDAKIGSGTKVDKVMQSECSHDPPCEVVRCCNIPQNKLEFQNAWADGPNCPKIGSVLGFHCSDEIKPNKKSKSSKGKQKKYIVMDAKENIGCQVAPLSKMECHHQPPCIAIPKCLGRIMYEGYVPNAAIPSCVHQPPCEMIPACCRKSAKMVSVYCQYPSPCRIV